MAAPVAAPAQWWVEDTGHGRPEEAAVGRAVAHLARWGHTLCGRDTGTPAWRPAQDTHPVCVTCSEVGPDRFVARDLTHAAGITYRQLDWWIAQGYVRPENPGRGQGFQRVFSCDEVAVTRLMGVLVTAGLRPAAAVRVARTGHLSPGVRVVVDDTPRACA